MRIGGSGLVAADLIPSGAGTMRNMDLVSERDGVLISPFANSASLASNFSCVQLLNASASGRRLLVDGIIMKGGATVSVQLRSHNTALSTDEGAWGSINPPATAANAHVFSERVSSLPGDLIVQYPKHSVIATKYWTLTYPIMLDEDEGLVICQIAVQMGMNAAFIGREV